MRLTTGRYKQLRDRRGGGGGLRDLDTHRIVQEGIGDALNFGRHGRREEKRLSRERYQFADPLDVGDESHVEHAVRFVDDEQLTAGQKQSSTLEVIEQAARRGDQYVDAAQQLGILVVERNAADDQRHVKLVVLAVLLEVLGDLRRKFTRRLENERARHTRASATLFQHGQHRQHEGSGFSGTGLRNTEHVAPRKHVWDGLVLNWGGSFVASRFDGSENFG